MPIPQMVLRPNYREGTEPHPSAENWIKDLLSRDSRVPWTARISNQFILKEISPEYSVEGLMLKLKLPRLWPPDVKN